VREAFEKSLNVPAVRVANDVGVDRVQEVWHQAGISGELSNTPAIALGVDDVTMRDLVAAYSMFPNLGVRTEPHLIESVEKGDNDEMYRYEVQRTDGIDPAVAYVLHALMRGVVIRGTAAGLNQYGLGYVAGKTGTTSNYRDAWFVGYVPDLLTAVWVGFDDGTPLRMSSGEAAIPIWGSFLSRVPHKTSDIGAPQGVSVVEVEAATGLVWQPGCGPSVIEAFLAGTEPRRPRAILSERAADVNLRHQRLRGVAHVDHQIRRDDEVDSAAAVLGEPPHEALGPAVGPGPLRRVAARVVVHLLHEALLVFRRQQRQVRGNLEHRSEVPALGLGPGALVAAVPRRQRGPRVHGRAAACARFLQ
jgi:membrane peptidoglycan carboxypeptidase